MKFFHSPGSCSDGIALLLAETGAAVEVQRVNVRTGEQRHPDYLATNPKGKVPALIRPDGRLLTEFPAIALWLARSYPQAALMPEGLEAEVRALELTDFIVSSIHMRGFTLVSVPGKFVQDPAAQAELVAHGRTVAESGLAYLSEVLGTGDYLLGGFGIADAAAWYVLNWAKAREIPISDRLDALQARISARPAAGIVRGWAA
ncbi:MAG: glutathione S-transferase N-terminal domain-containing protein [Rhodobacter sp.]|nr:glutathione S-transferase N-terminal domain-containing protein [Paracoccaceae bacterium]MCC0076531.1 glutathione S-transferase N-terminal domain-containing protein [Rhodobacter sp.]